MAVRNPSQAGPVTPLRLSTVVAGPPGPPGKDGAAGGATGPTGPKGDAGATGATGAQGPPGNNGTNGSNGAAGATGATGPAGPGAQPLGPDSAWTGDYYVAPTSGSDANAGTSSGAALKTYRRLAQILGTVEPTLTTKLQIHFTEPHTDSTDPVYLNPRLAAGGSCFLGGTPVSLATGTFGTVTQKSLTATDPRLTINLGTGATGHLAARGLMLVNTTRASSVAMIHQVISGTTVAVTQPLAANATMGTLPSAPVEHNDWVTGDSWVLYQLPWVNVVEYNPITGPGDSSGNFVLASMQHLYVPDTAVSGSIGLGVSTFAKGLTIWECVVDTYGVYPAEDTFGEIQGGNTCFFGGVLAHFCVFVGGCIGTPIGSGVVGSNSYILSTVLDCDLILSGSGIDCTAGSSFGAVACLGGITIGVTGGVYMSPGAFVGPYFSGTYSLYVGGLLGTTFLTGPAQMLYQTSAVATFKGHPTLYLDGVAVAFAEDFSLTPSPRYPDTALTPANIDATIASGGCGGIAQGYTGSSIAPPSFTPPTPTPYAPGGSPTGAAGGSLTGNYPNPGIHTSGVTAATYGDASHVPQIAINAEGRVTAASNVAVTVPNTAVTAGSYGGTSSAVAFTVGADGRLTAASTSTPFDAYTVARAAAALINAGAATPLSTLTLTARAGHLLIDVDTTLTVTSGGGAGGPATVTFKVFVGSTVVDTWTCYIEALTSTSVTRASGGAHSWAAVPGGVVSVSVTAQSDLTTVAGSAEMRVLSYAF